MLENSPTGRSLTKLNQKTDLDTNTVESVGFAKVKDWRLRGIFSLHLTEETQNLILKNCKMDNTFF